MSSLIFDILKSIHKVPGVLKAEQVVDPVFKGLDIVNANVDAVSGKVTTVNNNVLAVNTAVANVDAKVVALKASTDACCQTTQSNITASKNAIIAKIDAIPGGGGTAFDPAVILTPLATHDAGVMAKLAEVLTAVKSSNPFSAKHYFVHISGGRAFNNGNFVQPGSVCSSVLATTVNTTVIVRFYSESTSILRRSSLTSISATVTEGAWTLDSTNGKHYVEIKISNTGAGSNALALNYVNYTPSPAVAEDFNFYYSSQMGL